MAWSIEFSDHAENDFARLDKTIQRRIFRYLHERIANADDPAHSANVFNIIWDICGVIALETTAFYVQSKTRS